MNEVLLVNQGRFGFHAGEGGPVTGEVVVGTVEVEQAVNQKIRAAVAHLQTVKNGNAQLRANAKRLLIVGIVEVQTLLVGLAPGDGEVAVQEMVGDEYTGKAQGLVEFQILPDGCLRKYMWPTLCWGLRISVHQFAQEKSVLYPDSFP